MVKTNIKHSITTKNRPARLITVGFVHCTKISPEFECQRQRSKVKVTGDKKVRYFDRESSSGARSSCGIFSGAFLVRAVLRHFYVGGKINACCLVTGEFFQDHSQSFKY